MNMHGKRIINTLIHPKKNAISQGANLKTAGSPATRQFALELYTLPLLRQTAIVSRHSSHVARIFGRF